jgi:hypothetical protein
MGGLKVRGVTKIQPVFKISRFFRAQLHRYMISSSFIAALYPEPSVHYARVRNKVTLPPSNLLV